MVFCTRFCKSLATITSGASISTNSASASVMRSTNILRAWFNLMPLMRSVIPARHASTVSCSATCSDTHSSVSSASSRTCTRCTVTVKSAACSVPFGVAVKVSVAPFTEPVTSSSNVGATQPRPISYTQSSVLSPGTGLPSRVPARSTVM
ncbi:unannotated protein [freshwater metagenome]|uniref:Unannotated protein n=1 Tax=freshwater metagenome TaxID=449393 RepID=A0A6J7UWS8_9ZZZZ